MDTAWVIGVAIGIIAALIGVIYWAGQNRDDKQDERHERTEKNLAEHIRDDIAAHERLKAVETKVEHLEREVTGLRERWHDMRNELSETLSRWYLNVVKLIGGDK
jgi:uncharacterized membrane protein